MASVEIYTKFLCPYCTRAKALLTGKGVNFAEIDISTGGPRRTEMVERSGGRQTVPQQAAEAEAAKLRDGRRLGKDVRELSKPESLKPSPAPVAKKTVNDLLDLFTEGVVWSETSDYRQLLLGDTILMNERLAKFYESRVGRMVREQIETPEEKAARLEKEELETYRTNAQREKAQRWLLSISASDRVGLLYCVARVLARHHINLQLAKISTLGERVEDTFLVDGPELQQNKRQIEIETELLEALASA